MFQKIAKHCANDASNDVHCPPLVDTVFTVDTVNTVNTVYILFKLLYTAPQLAGMPIYIVREGENAIGMS